MVESQTMEIFFICSRDEYLMVLASFRNVQTVNMKKESLHFSLNKLVILLE